MERLRCDRCEEQLEDSQIGLCSDCIAEDFSEKELASVKALIKKASVARLRELAFDCYCALYVETDPVTRAVVVNPDKETGADIRDEIFWALSAHVGIECPDAE